MEKLTSQLSQLSDSKDESLTTFLGGLGMGIVLDSWDWFCQGLDKDSCELYSFCMLNKKNNDKCELGKIDNTQGKNPYQGFNDDDILKIPNSKMLDTAWGNFKMCKTVKETDQNKSIKNIFNFYKDENFNYDNYDILTGIIEEYKKKIKYISVDGYIYKYLEKIKKHIDSDHVLLDSIGKIINEINDIIKETKNFEKNFKSIILTYFADRLEKLFDKDDGENVLKEFKNILKYVLGSDNVLSNGEQIKNELETMILNTIKEKLFEKGSYRDYDDQIATIKTQLQNNKTLRNYLDDSKLITVKK